MENRRSVTPDAQTGRYWKIAYTNVNGEKRILIAPMPDFTYRDKVRLLLGVDEEEKQEIQIFWN